MSNTKKTYWKGLPQLKNDPSFVKHADKEFVDLAVQEDPGHSRSAAVVAGPVLNTGVGGVQVADFTNAHRGDLR